MSWENDAPEVYWTIRAARYLGVAPWVLAGCPNTGDCVYWRNWALVADIAEREAQAEADRIAIRRNNSG